MELEQAMQIALDGGALLFVGAGFSRGAVNLAGQPFKSGPELAAHLASRASLPAETGLEDAAEAFAEKYGVDKLIGEIQTEFTAREVALFHREILTIPWKRIYTTNYDDVVEVAARPHGKRLSPITIGMDIYKIPKDHTICIHLNGYAETLDRDKIWTELKLTETSYVTASIADTQWAMLFRQDLRLARAIFFVGYSLADLDIKRILFESDALRDKCFFYLGPNPDEATLRRVTKFGSVVTKSAEEFAGDMRAVAAAYVPTSNKGLHALAMKEYQIRAPSTPITDKAFIDLLLLGARTDDLIAESLRSGRKYLLERSAVSDVFRRIDKGKRVLVVCSDLGNGKSMLVEALRVRAVERGYRVFDVSEHTEGLDTELQAVASSGEKVIVIIEEYQNWLDEIRVFRTNASDQAVLVLTARNAVHDVLIDDLTTIAGVDEVSEVPVDVLDEQEIVWVVDSLNEYGLWGDRAGDSRSDKINFVRDECRGQLHALLLKLLQSPDIGKRFSALIQSLQKNGENYQVLLSVFIITLLNHGPTLDVLVDIWGVDLLSSPQFKRDPVVRQLIDFNQYAVLVRSPIAAEYLLAHVADANRVVSVLTKMAERTAKGAGTSPRYYELFKDLMRYSSVQAILPEEGRNNAIIRYYESIKNLSKCKFNPLFWLQYAIACLVMKDLPRAETYFSTAYSLGISQRFDTFQIDNHFARFLLVQAIQDLGPRDAMENFRRARAIINRQIRDERRHYPYRVAIAYQELIDRFGPELTAAELTEIARAATDVLSRITGLPSERQQHRYVVECEKALRYVVGKCGELSKAEQ